MSTDQFSQVYNIVASSDASNQRIDNFLLGHLGKKLGKIPKSVVYRILRKGEVRVNKKRVKPDYRVVPDDVVRIPPLKLSDRAPKVPSTQAIARSSTKLDLKSAILYENKEFLILNKPSGLAVHGGSGIDFGLIEQIRVLSGNPDMELVHRLDRETSGCIMVAKRKRAVRVLNALLRDKQIQKIYHLLVDGRQIKPRFTVTAPLLRYHRASGERMVKVDAAGQQAETRFTFLKQTAGGALLQAQPITGRTHQIRVHAAYQGYPILGDEKYGDAATAPRLCLHAAELKFVCPLSGEKIHVVAPYDVALQRFIT